MEQDISGISKFPEKRTTSRGEPNFSKRFSGNFLLHWILNRLVEWNAPNVFRWYIEMDHVIGFIKSRCIKNVTLKAATKEIRGCLGPLGRVGNKDVLRITTVM